MQEAINTLLRQLKELEKREDNLITEFDSLSQSLVYKKDELKQIEETKKQLYSAIELIQQGKSSGKVKKQKSK